MENFKEKIQKRLMFMALILMFGSAAYFILLFNQNNLPKIPDFIKGFQVGIFTTIELALVFYVAKYIACIKNEKSLKKLYIEENDERTIMIMQKTGAMGMTICIIGLTFATVITGFFNETIFFSLLGATLFTVTVKGFFKIYYHFKI